MAIAFVQFGGVAYFKGAWQPRTPSPNEDKTEDRFFERVGARGSVLLLHGLNFEAEAMYSLGQIFHDLGFQVLVPRLAGHRGRVEETYEDLLPTWRQQLIGWHDRLLPSQARAEASTPIVCAGYSLGALFLVEEFLLGHLDCDQFVLFSPALALRSPQWLNHLARSIFPKSFTVQSGIPQNYKHFASLGMGSSFSTADLVESLQANLQARKMPPGLVFLDERDEVIDAAEVKRMIKNEFTNWKLFPIQARDLPETHAFHLTVDEAHLGAEQWSRVREAITEALRNVGRGTKSP